MAAQGKKSAIESFNEICTIRITLVGAKPPIWRRVEVPTSITLLALHDVVQVVMGWHSSHLWEFSLGERRYGPRTDNPWDDGGTRNAGTTRLRSLLDGEKITLNYLYDFGDCWEHRLVVTDIRQGEPDGAYPRFVNGKRNGPPEDCGGLPGFYHALEALADPNHPEHAEVAEWLEEYDPEFIDTVWINNWLSRLANQRNGPRSRLKKLAGEPAALPDPALPSHPSELPLFPAAKARRAPRS